MRPPDPGRGVGKESEYVGCGGGPSPGDPRLIPPGTPSGVRRIFGRALNADIESVTLQSTIDAGFDLFSLAKL